MKHALVFIVEAAAAEAKKKKKNRELQHEFLCLVVRFCLGVEERPPPPSAAFVYLRSHVPPPLITVIMVNSLGSKNNEAACR